MIRQKSRANQRLVLLIAALVLGFSTLTTSQDGQGTSDAADVHCSPNSIEAWRSRSMSGNEMATEGEGQADMDDDGDDSVIAHRGPYTFIQNDPRESITLYGDDMITSFSVEFTRAAKVHLQLWRPVVEGSQAGNSSNGRVTRRYSLVEDLLVSASSAGVHSVDNVNWVLENDDVWGFAYAGSDNLPVRAMGDSSVRSISEFSALISQGMEYRLNQDSPFRFNIQVCSAKRQQQGSANSSSSMMDARSGPSSRTAATSSNYSCNRRSSWESASQNDVGPVTYIHGKKITTPYAVLRDIEIQMIESGFIKIQVWRKDLANYEFTIVREKTFYARQGYNILPPNIPMEYGDHWGFTFDTTGEGLILFDNALSNSSYHFPTSVTGIGSKYSYADQSPTTRDYMISPCIESFDNPNQIYDLNPLYATQSMTDQYNLYQNYQGGGSANNSGSLSATNNYPTCSCLDNNYWFSANLIDNGPYTFIDGEFYPETSGNIQAFEIEAHIPGEITLKLWRPTQFNPNALELVWEKEVNIKQGYQRINLNQSIQYGDRWGFIQASSSELPVKYYEDLSSKGNEFGYAVSNSIGQSIFLNSSRISNRKYKIRPCTCARQQNNQQAPSNQYMMNNSQYASANNQAYGYPSQQMQNGNYSSYNSFYNNNNMNNQQQQTYNNSNYNSNYGNTWSNYTDNNNYNNYNSNYNNDTNGYSNPWNSGANSNSNFSYNSNYGNNNQSMYGPGYSNNNSANAPNQNQKCTGILKNTQTYDVTGRYTFINFQKLPLGRLDTVEVWGRSRGMVVFNLWRYNNAGQFVLIYEKPLSISIGQNVYSINTEVRENDLYGFTHLGSGMVPIQYHQQGGARSFETRNTYSAQSNNTTIAMPSQFTSKLFNIKLCLEVSSAVNNNEFALYDQSTSNGGYNGSNNNNNNNGSAGYTNNNMINSSPSILQILSQFIDNLNSDTDGGSDNNSGGSSSDQCVSDGESTGPFTFEANGPYVFIGDFGDLSGKCISSVQYTALSSNELRIILIKPTSSGFTIVESETSQPQADLNPGSVVTVDVNWCIDEAGGERLGFAYDRADTVPVAFTYYWGSAFELYDAPSSDGQEEVLPQLFETSKSFDIRLCTASPQQQQGQQMGQPQNQYYAGIGGMSSPNNSMGTYNYQAYNGSYGNGQQQYNPNYYNSNSNMNMNYQSDQYYMPNQYSANAQYSYQSGNMGNSNVNTNYAHSGYYNYPSNGGMWQRSVFYPQYQQQSSNNNNNMYYAQQQSMGVSVPYMNNQWSMNVPASMPKACVGEIFSGSMMGSVMLYNDAQGPFVYLLEDAVEMAGSLDRLEIESASYNQVSLFVVGKDQQALAGNHSLKYATDVNLVPGVNTISYQNLNWQLSVGDMVGFVSMQNQVNVPYSVDPQTNEQEFSIKMCTSTAPTTPNNSNNYNTGLQYSQQSGTCSCLDNSFWQSANEQQFGPFVYVNDIDLNASSGYIEEFEVGADFYGEITLYLWRRASIYSERITEIWSNTVTVNAGTQRITGLNANFNKGDLWGFSFQGTGVSPIAFVYNSNQYTYERINPNYSTVMFISDLSRANKLYKITPCLCLYGDAGSNMQQQGQTLGINYSNGFNSNYNNGYNNSNYTNGYNNSNYNNGYNNGNYNNGGYNNSNYNNGGYNNSNYNNVGYNNSNSSYNNGYQSSISNTSINYGTNNSYQFCFGQIAENGNQTKYGPFTYINFEPLPAGTIDYIRFETTLPGEVTWQLWRLNGEGEFEVMLNLDTQFEAGTQNIEFQVDTNENDLIGFHFSGDGEIPIKFSKFVGAQSYEDYSAFPPTEGTTIPPPDRLVDQLFNYQVCMYSVTNPGPIVSTSNIGGYGNSSSQQ